ncbi:signal transduction histidine kinase [Cylindrospermum sp. NIES-4074]|nr:signal transduction histidine kinase [Cylindrospermum sp. NIES-4074]
MLFPENESQRLEALRQYQILDTPSEAVFDDLAQLAADLCETPIALISLIDAEREWFKSKIGVTRSEFPRHLSFGDCTIEQNQILIIPDTLQNERFATNPLVISDANYRFYAGVPLINSDGFALGCLCVIDFSPRNLGVKEQAALQSLTKLVIRNLELHRQKILHDQSEVRYQTIFETLPMPLVISRLSDGMILDANQEFRQIFRWSSEDLANYQTSELYHNPSEREEVLAAFAQNGSGQNYEIKLKRLDGNSLWAITSLKNLQFNGEIAILKVFYDITNRKDAEARIIEQNDFLRTIFEIIPLMISLIDAKGKLKWVNHEWERVIGWNMKDIQTSDLLESLYPDFEYRQSVINFIQSAHNVWGDFRTQVQDGRVIDTSWINFRLANGQIIGIGQDITERKQSERALRATAEREQLMRTIAERIRQSLNLQDILNATVTEVRDLLQVDRVVVYQFAADMSGAVVAESVEPGWTIALGKEINDTCFQNGIEQGYHQGIKRAIANIYEADLTDCHIHLLAQFEVKANLVVPILLKVDGDHVNSRLWGLLIAHQCSGPREWEQHQLDLLDQLTVQIAIAIQQSSIFQQAQSELAQRHKAEVKLRSALAEKEVLLKEIHHRVKNNLQIVSSLLQLQAHTLKDPEVLRALRESQNRIESISLIHKNLYTSPNIGNLDVADYINNLAANLLISYQIGPGRIGLKTNIAPVNLNVDQAIACGLIINELISNALKHAFPNEQVGTIYIKLHTHLNSIEMTVQDNGIGLPNDLNWRNTDSLGLSLVYDLVTEQLEGTITVERNQGTVFNIQFPQLTWDK